MLGKELTEFIQALTDGANNVSALSTSGILALVVFYQGWRGWQLDKDLREKEKLDSEIRTQKAVVESKTADALAKLGDAYERLADKQEIAFSILGRKDQ